MLTLSDRPRGRILLATTAIPAEYHAERLRWWTANSASWSEHIDADVNRRALLDTLARKAVDLVHPNETPVVTDVGCGEGAFLRALRGVVPAGALHGVDFCPTMVNSARQRSAGLGISYTVGDLEEPSFVPRCATTLLTSILAVDEMDRLDVAFVNIARSLSPGGIAMIVVMDPLKEIERNREELRSYFDGGSLRDDEAVLLVKTFPTQKTPKTMGPTSPYSRIVRPLAHYSAAARAAGLQSGPVEPLVHAVGMGRYSDTLAFDVLTFRKPSSGTLI